MNIRNWFSKSTPQPTVEQARAAYLAASVQGDMAARDRAWRDLQAAIARAGTAECGGAA